MSADEAAERIGWTIAALLVVFAGLQLWTGSTVIAWMNPVALAVTLAGLLAIWRVWAAANAPSTLDQSVIMVALVVALFVRGYLAVTTNSTYGTDELAFSQYAAELFLHGQNPYTHSMLPSLQQFLVPPIYHTYLLDGTPVSSYSYPALSFLLHVPALLAGLRMQAAVFTDLTAWAVSALLLWRLLPQRAAWAAGVVLSLTMYTNFVVGGVTDALFLPFCLLAVWRWDRFCSHRGALRFLGPIALGLAMSVKQTPWFLMPFLISGVVWEARRNGRSVFWQPLAYLGVAAGAFVTINSAFLIANPHAWLHGTLLPLLSPTVASGQGLVNLSLFEHLGGRLPYYTLAGAAAALLALVLFVGWYPRLKRAWVPLVAVVFFWPTRSFASYLIDLVPIALVAGTTVSAAPKSLVPRTVRRLRLPAAAGAAAVFGAAVVLALTASPPLELRIVGTESTGQQQTIDGISVVVTNRSDAPVRPHFTLVKGGYLTSFWYPYPAPHRQSNAVVPAHSSRRLFLRAPNAQSMPRIGGGFVLEAFTNRPAAVSASKLVLPAPYRLVLLPSAISRPLAVGEPLVLTARLVDLRGNPVSRGGVRVALGQVVYGQRAIISAQASINGKPEGQTPVTTTTDKSGVARFRVVGVQPQHDPVFFQAWVSPPGGTPHGYSSQVSVQFVS